MVIKTLSSYSEDIALACCTDARTDREGVVIDIPIYVKGYGLIREFADVVAREKQ